MASNEFVFIKNGSFYVVKRDKFESMERFNERGWYVVNRSPKNEVDFQEAVRMSRVWVNSKFDELGYKQIG